MKFFVGKICLSLLFFSFSASAVAETIVVSGHPEYPPFMYKKGNEIVGVDLDIVKLVFQEKLNIQVKSKYTGNWKRCLKEAENGTIDLVLAGYINENRKKYLDFTNTPIAEDPLAVFVAKGKEFPFDTWDDLIGRKAISTLGDSQGQEFDDFLINNNIRIERVSHRIQNFKKLLAGRADFYPAGKYATLILLKRHQDELKRFKGKIVALPKPLKLTYIYMAITKTSKFNKHLKTLDQELLNLSSNGTIKKWLDKHISLAAKLPSKPESS